MLIDLIKLSKPDEHVDPLTSLGKIHEKLFKNAKLVNDDFQSIFPIQGGMEIDRLPIPGRPISPFGRRLDAVDSPRPRAAVREPPYMRRMRLQ